MLFVGLDLHKKYTEYAVMDVAGTVQRQGRVENTLEEMKKFSESVPAKSSMVIESSSTWYWAHRLLSERHDVMLSNPIRNKAIASAKVKTDKIDSITLANLLRGGWAAECYVPSKETMEFRELVRFRANLVRERTKMKNRIHAYLLMNNIPVDARPFTKGFVEEVRKLDEPRVQSYLRLIDALNAEILEASTIIKQRAGNNEDANLLMTIPGVDYLTALTVMAEIADINRFSTPWKLVSYAGLSPSHRDSAGKIRRGHITKQGSRWLRYAIGEAANTSKVRDDRLKQFYERIAQRRGPQKAKVATAKEMLVIMWYMLTRNEPYRGMNQKSTARKYKEMEREANQLG